jgi:malonyl-CoA decarboxylase
VLQQDQPNDGTGRIPDSAIFYSISNCQPGLSAVSFGDFLIKHVTDELALELPNIRTFATLSPIPGFKTWLTAMQDKPEPGVPLDDAARTLLAKLDDPDWHRDAAVAAQIEPVLLRLCAHYLLEARKGGSPVDPVARFHLRNGARLERINWLGDPSASGMRQSVGMLVNYVYDRRSVAQNHEAYVSHGEIASSVAVQQLLKAKVIAA